eukprot:5746875-Amphidinium_carterae.1
MCGSRLPSAYLMRAVDTMMHTRKHWMPGRCGTTHHGCSPSVLSLLMMSHPAGYPEPHSGRTNDANGALCTDTEVQH